MEAMISSIIASSVVAAVISSLVSYKLKNLEFRNEYYKIVIQKRLDSYSAVERIILLLQTIVTSDGIDKYHEIFSSWSSLNEFNNELHIAKYKGFWLALSTLNIINSIEDLLIVLNDNFSIERHDNCIDAGINYFQDLNDLKLRLEKACRYDILHLHKIK